MATAAQPRARHWGVMISFVLLVILPTALAGYYMFAIAVDQYESRVGFAVRAEESQSALDILGGLSGLSKASSSDTDILYEFIQSQDMVERVAARLDLEAMFTRPAFDPVFALNPDSSIEDKLDYWARMVRIYYDGGTGLIEIRVFAFTPGDAHQIATVLLEEVSRLINDLSAIAREDATRYAAEERDKAIARLIAARQALTAFRVSTQIVDPTADIAGQMGLLNTLQTELAQTLIEQDMLQQTAKATDPRLSQIALRIEVIEARIADERRKLGVGGPLAGDGAAPAGGYAGVIGEFEKLQVDLQFAETTYLTALSAYDAAVSEAQRTSRYLTTYVRPTLAQTSTAPDRLLLTGLVAGFAFLTWVIALLIYYSLRDRR